MPRARGGRTNFFDRKLQDDQEKVEKERDRRKASIKTKVSVVQHRWDENERLEADAEDLKNKLDNIKTAERRRQKNIQDLHKHIAEIQQRIDNPPQFENEDELNVEIVRQTNTTAMRRTDNPIPYAELCQSTDERHPEQSWRATAENQGADRRASQVQA